MSAGSGAFVAAGGAAGGAAAAVHAESFSNGYLILKPAEFLKLVSKSGRNAVVVVIKEREGVINRKDVYAYVSKYGELTIMTRSATQLPLPSNAEVVTAEKLVLPPAVRSRLNSVTSV